MIPLTPEQIAERIRGAVVAGRYPQPDYDISARRVKKDSRYWIVCGLVDRSNGHLYVDPKTRENIEEAYRVREMFQKMGQEKIAAQLIS